MVRGRRWLGPIGGFRVTAQGCIGFTATMRQKWRPFPGGSAILVSVNVPGSGANAPIPMSAHAPGPVDWSAVLLPARETVAAEFPAEKRFSRPAAGDLRGSHAGVPMIEKNHACTPAGVRSAVHDDSLVARVVGA
jgi:hypothetical protein